MVIDEPAMMWFRLRERRSSLAIQGRLVDDEDRRATFAAAMQQFEEQYSAAKVVTPVTRPLNLYYGLAQAGLAVSAVHGAERWAFKHHGLTMANSAAELPNICVRPQGDGAFQSVTAATGSPSIATAVSLGSIWASLPDLCDVVTLKGSSHCRALDLIVDDMARVFMVSSFGPPKGIGPFRASVFFNLDLPDPVNQVAWLTEQLAHYPSASGWRLAKDNESFERIDDRRRFRVPLEWPQTEVTSDDDSRAFFDMMAPSYRYTDNRYLRPAIEEKNAAPPSPLMTWWLLLYSFSMLARYFPRTWVALLDLDQSPYAVALQYACEEALAVIPHLVLEALDGQPLPLRQTMML